ncbi:MAG: B12-binding domain-containing radical SAM protein [Anaerolineaceae bacterium]|nr:B12-binding domain-containing radical SAM protein [Anaerolineaceae bacterium]MCB9098073.1 B12-binding domain-containing radical SAM protein [Anaerolineales bacterium]
MEIRKIVLIQPGREGRIFGKAPAASYTLMRLASLVPNDIDVEIWHNDWDPVEKKLRSLGKHDLVGITAKTLEIEQAEYFAQIAREAGVETIVVGGNHATLMPEDVKRWADVVVTGEAYRTWPKIIADFQNDTLQPHYDDTEWADLKGVAPLTDRVINQVDERRRFWTPMMEITRGCPRNCSFCTAIRVSGQKMRFRPVEEIVEEIERRKLDRFFLTDDNFGLAFIIDPEYTEKLFLALEKLPLRGWTTQAEMAVAKYPELLKLAKRAHLDKFFIGFESVNPDNWRELGGKSKGLIKQYQASIKGIQEHGIGVVGLFVFGFDNDTPQVMWDTWEFGKNSGLDSMSTTVLTPYPGTPFREQLLQEDRLIPDKTWRYYDTAHVVYYPKQMTVPEFEQEYDKICRAIYSPYRIAQRGLRALARHPIRRMPAKAFGSFSTDYGYRRTFAWRHAFSS